MLRVLSCLLALGLAVAHADGDDRQRLLQERQAVQERYAAEERDCQQRFAVSACIESVRVRRREALMPLREREFQLDDAERLQRARERQSVRAERQAQAASAAAVPAPAASVPSRQPAPPPPVRSRVGESHQTQIRAERAAEAAARAQAAQRRAEETRAAQAEVARRVQQREASGRKSAPLPPPDAAASGPR